MKKVLLGIVAVLIMLLLAAILAPFVLDLNKYKETILAQVEPLVPRDVDFGYVELTILTGLGVEIQDLRVSENPAFSQGDFLKLERLQIRLQFLAESLLLAALGGAGGVVLGAAVTTGYAYYQAWPTLVPAWATGGGIAATLLIGGIAGLYPAWRAARLSPTEALVAP